MMQTLRPSDVLRCILHNLPKGANLACPAKAIASDKPEANSLLWKETLAQRRNRVTVLKWADRNSSKTSLACLASARVRSGYRAWELDRLFLPSDSGDGVATGSSHVNGIMRPQTIALELLDGIVLEIGARRAERVLLRIPSGSPMFTLARQAGFFPYFEETLLEKLTDFPQRNLVASQVPWQDLLPEDQYSLFQLYCAATPQPVRTAMGLTFDQWRDNQDWGGRHRNLVAKHGGKVVAWLGLSRCGQVTSVEGLVQPGMPELWESLVERSMEQGAPHRWLVPDYQDSMTQLLLRRHFTEVAYYTVMIKMVAVPVGKHGMATVEA